MTLNSLRVQKRDDTLLIALPPDHCEPIRGGCSCPHCVAHPELTPMWDTLAVSTDPKNNPYTWLVHKPIITA